MLADIIVIFVKKINMTHKYDSKFDKEEILSLIKKGYNLKKISKIVDIPERRLGELVKQHNMNANRWYRNNTDHSFFDNIDNEYKAYILGFILADGCVLIEPKKRNNIVYSYNKRITFCNSVDDYEIIEQIRNIISPKAFIKFSHNEKGVKSRKIQCQLKISSVGLVNKLIELNIKPNKTKDINFVFDFNKIQYNLQRHFIRGFFDGDGCISKHNCYYTFSFVSTSYFFMLQLQDIFNSLFPNINSNICTYKNKNMITYNLVFYLGVKEEKIKSIFDYFYKDSNIFLLRKYKKFIHDNTVLIN